MKRVLLALGANQGDRLDNLERAVAQLDGMPAVCVTRVSSVFETRALLAPGAPPEWDIPYCNIAARVETTLDPFDLLAAAQSIERRLGRSASAARWAPRPIDIDIIAYGHELIDTDRLCVPHPLAQERAFVLAPCAELEPALRLEGSAHTLLEAKRRLGQPLPAWMQIINVTPDSFSGDGSLDHAFADADLVNYVDIGAESTRPGAVLVDSAEEWDRLEPILERFDLSRRVRPRISIDTRNPSTAARALRRGVDVINDVGGLRDGAMREVLAGAACDVVLMHSLSVPADPRTTLPERCDPVAEVRTWLLEQLEALERGGIAAARVIVDPGIGFGKSPLQSMELVQRAREFTDIGCRILYGHSRKSFLQSISRVPAGERDIETLALSMYLAGEGVDVLRVHAPAMHRRYWAAHERVCAGR